MTNSEQSERDRLTAVVRNLIETHQDKGWDEAWSVDLHYFYVVDV